MSNKSKFNSKKQRHWCSFWVFFVTFEWILMLFAVISIGEFEPAFVYCSKPNVSFPFKNYDQGFNKSEE